MILIALAGVAAGAINSLVGSGTLVTFPTLVALGYPPVVSTMSNAIGLVAGGISGTWGYRRELRGQWHRLRWQIPASFVGALVGAWLLLHLPEKVFTEVVPVLLIACADPRRDRAEDPGLGAQAGRGRRPVGRACVAGPHGGVGDRHVRRRYLRRLLHRRAGHPADGGDGRAAARGHAADERRQEPAVPDRECRCGSGLHHSSRSTGSAGRRRD